MVISANQLQQAEPELQEIGRLYKGSRKIERQRQDGSTYLSVGKDLEYFRFEPSDRLFNLPGDASDGYENLYEELTAKWAALKEVTFGWRSLPILLPHRTIKANYWYKNAVYDKSGRCVRSCNGEICDRYQVDAKTAQGKPYKAVVKGAIKCAMKEGDKECPMGCKAEAKLKLIIPALSTGMVLITTKSEIDIKTLLGNLKAYEHFDLSRIPMRLCRSLRDASYWEDGEYKKQEKWLLHLEIDPQYGQLALEAQQRQYKAELMGVPVASLQLPGQLNLPQLPQQQPRSLAPAVSTVMPQEEAAQQYPEKAKIWAEVNRLVTECVQARDVQKLESVIAGAYQRIEYGALPEKARLAIASLHDQALESITTASIGFDVTTTASTATSTEVAKEAVPKPKSKKKTTISTEVDPATTPEAIALAKRLSRIKDLANLSDVQPDAICTSLKLDAARFYEWSEDQVKLFRNHVFGIHLFSELQSEDRERIVQDTIATFEFEPTDDMLFEALMSSPEFSGESEF